MTDARLLLYASSNGDRWSLCRGETATDVFVLHEANVPSGGVTSRVELGSFLLDGVPGPQHDELLRRLGALVDRGEAVAPVGGPQPEAGAAATEPTPGEDA